MSRRRSVVKRSGGYIATAELIAPPVNPVEALRNAYFAALEDACPQADLVTVIRTQVEKAIDKKDTKAANLIMSSFASMARSSMPSEEYDADCRIAHREAMMMSDTRRNIVLMLCANGPMTTQDIVQATHAARGDVLNAIVDHEWFQQEAGKWSTTAEALTHVPEVRGK